MSRFRQRDALARQLGVSAEGKSLRQLERMARRTERARSNPLGKVGRSYPAPEWALQRYPSSHPLAQYRQAFAPHPWGGWTGRIDAGSYLVSVVASNRNYSEPSANLDDPFAYESYEVAILDSWGNITRPPQYMGRLRSLFEAGDKPVAGWVKPEDVAQMIEVLRDEARVQGRVAAASGWDPRGMLPDEYDGDDDDDDDGWPI